MASPATRMTEMRKEMEGGFEQPERRPRQEIVVLPQNGERNNVAGHRSSSNNKAPRGDGGARGAVGEAEPLQPHARRGLKCRLLHIADHTNSHVLSSHRKTRCQVACFRDRQRSRRAELPTSDIVTTQHAFGARFFRTVSETVRLGRETRPVDARHQPPELYKARRNKRRSRCRSGSCGSGRAGAALAVAAQTAQLRARDEGAGAEREDDRGQEAPGRVLGTAVGGHEEAKEKFSTPVPAHLHTVNNVQEGRRGLADTHHRIKGDSAPAPRQRRPPTDVQRAAP